jgi:hypothetical protein
VLAYRRDQTVMSKAEAGNWGLRHAPEEYQPLIAEAAAFYAGTAEGELDRAAVTSFIDWVRDA